MLNLEIKNEKKELLLITVIVTVCLLIVGFSYLGNYQNRRFKDYVVFYPQQQDDEVLWAGNAIVEAIEECGRDNVYIVQVSNISGIYVFNKDEKYKNLTREEKTKLREKEFLESVDALGVKRENDKYS